MKTLSNQDIQECLNLLENEMNKWGYESSMIRRYSMLIEEALLKWQGAFGENAELSFEILDKRKSFRLVYVVDGKRVYPYESQDGPKEYLQHMHERLLSGTGCEFRYSYLAGKNKLYLTLPKENHEVSIFNKNVWFLAVPVAMQVLFTTAITATDSILMGLLEQDSLSAISMATAYIELFNIIMTALVTGTTIFASQCWGRRDRDGINRILQVSICFSVVMALIFFIPACFAPRSVMSVYTNVPVLIEKGSLYLRLISPMFLCASFFQIYYAILKNTGKVIRFAMYMVLAAVIDFSLNIILVFGYLGFPAMGIRGAAWGSAISAAFQFVACTIDCVVNKDIHIFAWSGLKKSKGLFVEYIKKTVTVSAQMVSWMLANNIVTSIFGHMGSDIVAANGTVTIISDMAIFACAGLYNTAGILVGSRLGNNRLEEAKLFSKRYFKITTVVGLCTTLAILLLAFNVRILPFKLTDTAFEFLQTMLYVVAFELLFKGLNCIMNFGGLYAGGDTFALLIIDSINMWLIIVPVGLICLYLLKLPPIVVALLLHFDEFTSFPFKIARYRKYKWVKNINVGT